MKGREELSFGVPDTVSGRPNDLTAKEIATTLSMIYIVNFFEGADMQLLPSSYRALEADLGLSPTTLAASSLMQSLTGGWIEEIDRLHFPIESPKCI